MCGIIAHLAFDPSASLNTSQLTALNALQTHRGPDAGGVFQKGQVGLAMRRLSIIDLAGGYQPMTSADGRYTLVFNGEIYNHDQLRQEFIRKGYSFKTRSDTEVLLTAFIDQKEKCLALLNGMFAFAVWDDKERQLFLARDRMGEKPLYYARNAKQILFTSELTPIFASRLFDLNFSLPAISNYLAYWYICEPDTIFEEVKQLPPASYMVVSQEACQISKYWRIPVEAERRQTLDEAVDQLEGLLKDAINLRMKVDVPIGTFLSGGIDSGIITALAAQSQSEPVTAFSIGFKEKSYSELPEAQLAAKHIGVNWRTTLLDNPTPELLEKIFMAFDEPLGNASYFPTYLLARAARQELKVVLTGDGGDELFGGYPTYQAEYFQNLTQRLPGWMLGFLTSAAQSLPVSHQRISLDYRLKQFMKGRDLPYARAHTTWREVANGEDQQRLFHPECWQALRGHQPFVVAEPFFAEATKLSRKNQLMYVDLNTYLLNDHLRKVDRMTMAHSLEARLPFLDHRIVEFAMSLPSEHKVDFFQTKKILKRLARKYLPASLIKGKKKGLTSPIADWISHDLRDYVQESLRGGIVGQFFNQTAVDSLIQEHVTKKFDRSRILWGLLTLQGWGRKYQHYSRQPLSTP